MVNCAYLICDVTRDVTTRLGVFDVMATYSHQASDITVADQGFLRGGARQPQRECANLLFGKKCNRIKKITPGGVGDGNANGI